MINGYRYADINLLFSANLQKIQSCWQLIDKDMAELFAIERNRYASYRTSRRAVSVTFVYKLSQLTKISMERLWTISIEFKEIPIQPIRDLAITKEKKEAAKAKRDFESEANNN